MDIQFREIDIEDMQLVYPDSLTKSSRPTWRFWSARERLNPGEPACLVITPNLYLNKIFQKTLLKSLPYNFLKNTYKNKKIENIEFAVILNEHKV